MLRRFETPVVGLGDVSFQGAIAETKKGDDVTHVVGGGLPLPSFLLPSRLCATFPLLSGQERCLAVFFSLLIGTAEPVERDPPPSFYFYHQDLCVPMQATPAPDVHSYSLMPFFGQELVYFIGWSAFVGKSPASVWAAVAHATPALPSSSPAMAVTNSSHAVFRRGCCC